MENFEELINGEKPVLVDFYASWCGPCKVQAPILDDVKHAVGDSAHIIKIDIDKNRKLAAKYKVLSVPTLMLFKHGDVTWRVTGVQHADIIEAKIKGI
jgi:thioredoxin 1